MVPPRVPHAQETRFKRHMLWPPFLSLWLWMVQPGASLITSLALLLIPTCFQATNTKLAALNGLTWSVWSSRGAGLVLAFDGGLILLPMLRNILRVIRPKLSWLFPADENIWFHRQVAYSMAFWAMVHTTAHYVNFFNVERTRK